MKIGLLITARLKSTRLPMKLMLDLNGRSIIERVIERSKSVQGVDQIILCTSTNSQDKPLTDVALAEGIHYYLGSEQDVLQRLFDASTFFNLDYILSITGENPFFSIEYAHRTIDLIKKHGGDFTVFEGLPIGCAVYGLKVKALELVCKVKREVDTEIWGPLINRPELFKVVKEDVADYFYMPQLRITTDYFEDYQFLNALSCHFGKEEIPSLYSILNLIKNNPGLLEIHKEKKQAQLSKEQITRIDEYFSQNLDELLELKNKIYNKSII